MISDENVQQAYVRVPPPLRAILDSDTAIPEVVSELGYEYKLHIDQIGTIAEATRNMLLGLIRPHEFLEGLLEARIPEEDARRIMGEINEKIFKPVQAEMRKSGTMPSPAPAPAPKTPTLSVPPPRGRPSAMPVAPGPSALPREAAPTPRPVTAPAPSYGAATSQPASDRAPLPPKTVLPGASAPVFHNPLPPREVPPAPPNLPTGSARMGSRAYEVLPETYASVPPAEPPPPPPSPQAPPIPPQASEPFNAFPPLQKPSAAKPVSEAQMPRPSSDPYREPFE